MKWCDNLDREDYNEWNNGKKRDDKCASSSNKFEPIKPSIEKNQKIRDNNNQKCNNKKKIVTARTWKSNAKQLEFSNLNLPKPLIPYVWYEKDGMVANCKEKTAKNVL